MVSAYLALKLACESLKKGYNKNQICFSMATVTVSVNNNSFCCSYSTKFRAKFNIYSVNFSSSLVGSVLLAPVGVSLSSVVPNLSSGFYESTWPHKNDKISGWQSLLSKASLS